jgi:hypothetical protein
MVDLGMNLNVDEEVENYKGEFQVLAPGWYNVVITESEVKDNSNKTGKLLVFTYETDDGSTVKDNLNIAHTNEIAQKIGLSTLAKISESVGHKGQLTNTDVLHGRPFAVKITIEEFKSNTSDKMLKSNKVVAYKKKMDSVSQPKSDTGKKTW